jgi:hypothetical protein
MTQYYASHKFLQVSFLISDFITDIKLDSTYNLKSPQVNMLLEGVFFAASLKGVTDTTVYTYFKTQTSFVNYYLDFALSRGGGGGGGDDDWVVDYFDIPNISGNFKIIKEINTI